MNQAVADAVGTHRHVTAVLRHAARDENRDHASTEVDEKGRQANDCLLYTSRRLLR